MILESATNTIDIGRAQYPAPAGKELMQVSERSASGIKHTEDYNVKIDTFTYNFIDMEEAKYLLLVDFFLNDAVGIMNNFDLTDDKAVTRTVRFVESKLPFKETFNELWSGNFTVEVAS